jgi:hypothetical protein
VLRGVGFVSLAELGVRMLTFDSQIADNSYDLDLYLSILKLCVPCLHNRPCR